MTQFWPIVPLIILILFLALVALTVWVSVLQRRLDSMKTGHTDVSLVEGTDEGALATLPGQIQALAERIEGLSERVVRLETQAPGAIQRVGVVRFNPFADTGGDQSFAVALLDGDGSGVVLSALYSRGGVRVYAKPIVGGRSDYHLSNEERQAISRAMHGGL